MASLDSSESSNAGPDASLRDDPGLRARNLEVAEVLGEGGSSVVYRARDGRQGRDVAVKLLREQPELPRARERFEREIRVAAGLRHPHILPLFDSGELADGRPFFVMPIAQGRPLSAMIAEGPLTVSDAIRLTREIAQALYYLHERGFVHRDVKPDNILVESGHAVLTDFGVATTLDALAAEPRGDAATQRPQAPTTSARFTEVGVAVGTPEYMSPESLYADGPVDGRSDMYSLGLVLFEMLSGALPFGDSPPREQLMQRLRKALPDLHAVRSDVPAALAQIVARSTALDPAERFPTALAMDDALAAAETQTRATSPKTPPARDYASVGLGALLTLSIVAAAVGYRVRAANTLDPQVVVVADLANDTGDSTLTRVGLLAGDYIVSAISANTDLQVVNAVGETPSRLQTVLPSTDSTLARATRRLVASAHAGIAITGAYFLVSGEIELVAEVMDTRSGRVLGVAGPFRSSLAELDAPLQALGRHVVRILKGRHAPPE